MRWSRVGLLKVVIIPASLGAGLIHFAVAPSHFEEYWLFVAFFLVAGRGTNILLTHDYQEGR